MIKLKFVKEDLHLHSCIKAVKEEIELEKKYFSKEQSMEEILLKIRKGYYVALEDQKDLFNITMFDALNLIEKKFLKQKKK